MTDGRTTPRVTLLALAGALAILAAACGGSSPDGSAGAASTDDASGSGAGIEITGAATGVISQPGGCGEDVGDASSWNGNFQTDDGAWTLDITLEGTKEPGRYPIGDHEAGKATVFLYAGGGGASYDAVPGAGVVDADGDPDHGRVDLELADPAGGPNIKVVGDWTCES